MSHAFIVILNVFSELLFVIRKKKEPQNFKDISYTELCNTYNREFGMIRSYYQFHYPLHSLAKAKILLRQL